MNTHLTAMAACAAALAFGSSALAGPTVSVPATGDLYLAGAPAGTQCCAGDSTTNESPVLAPVTLSAGEYLTFSTTGSATNYPGGSNPTADGNTSGTYNLHADYGTGISGPNDIHLAGLAGVFLGPNQPSGSPPPQLSGTDFASVSPELNQMFFIGDGLTGTGTGSLQTFYVPAGATRLFLGVADDGGYYDNSGTIFATISEHVVSAAPEPSEWVLMMLGLGLLGFGMRIRREQRKIAAAA